MEVALSYSADEDGIIRLEKDLNHLLTNLDHENVRQLYTEYCSIQSAAGETKINGPLLTMYDLTPTLRLLAGYDASTADFVFKLWNALGEETISLDAGGDAIFAGSIQTPKDAYVGEHLFVGADTSDIPYTGITTNTRGIFIPVPGTTNILGHIYSTNPGVGSSDWHFEIESSQSFNLTAKRTMRIYSYANYDTISTVSINSTDFISINSWNNRTFINTAHPASNLSTVKGVMLGDDFNNVFLGPIDFPSARVSINRDLELDFEHKLNYFYSRNQKEIEAPTTVWMPNIATNVTFWGTISVRTSTRVTCIRCSDTDSVYVQLESTIPSVDMTKFTDGSAATSDDYLVVICYTNSTSSMNPSHGFILQMGHSSTDYYRYYSMASNGYDFSTGWNMIVRKIGSYESIYGNPSLNNISYIRAGFRAYANSTNATVAFDYIGIHRAESTGTNMFQDFQLNFNSTWENSWDNSSDDCKWIVHSKKSGVVISPADTHGGPFDLFLKNSNFFQLEIKALVLSENSLPLFTWYSDDDNYFDAYISSGVLRISNIANGTTNGNYVNCAAFSQFDDITFKMTKEPLGRYTAAFQVDNQPETIRYVEIYSTYKENIKGSLWLGTVDDSNAIIKSIKINGFTG